MFIFQGTGFAEQFEKATPIAKPLAVANAVAKQFKDFNPEFKKEVEQKHLDDRGTLDLAMSTKYHDKFRDFFINTAGQSQWNQFEKYYRDSIVAAQTEHQADMRHGIDFSAKISRAHTQEGQTFATKSTNEFIERNPIV